MDTKKEIWIEQTLSSVDGIRQSVPSKKLMERLTKIPFESAVLNNTIPMKAIWLAAASILLLISVNILTIQKTKQSAKSDDSSIYNSYFSYLDEI